MKADPHAQTILLDVQAIDTTLAQLAHRRATLPELEELDRLAREISALHEERARARAEVDDLDRDIARLERDVEQVRARKEKDSARLVQGSGPARELTALQHELESLTRRQNELEDAELEVMERREQAQAALDGVAARLASARERRAEAQARRDSAIAEITEQEGDRVMARGPLVAQLPVDLISLYERIRGESGGLGAALLRSGRCGGCRLELSGTERARVRAAPPDEVVRCDDCRRIMVRTAESGL